VKIICGLNNCTRLVSLDFSNCSELKILNGFNMEISLQNIIFPPNVKTIGEFHDCRSLVSLNLSNCLQLEKIENFAFFKAWSLQTIQFSPNLKIIQNCAFQNSSRLTSLQIPASVEIIEENSFNSCEQLEQVTFEGPTILGEYAFDNCPNLIRKIYLQNRYVDCVFGKYSELKQSLRFEITECGITLEKFEDDSNIVILRCGHAFLKEALEEWMKRQLICPFCKQRI
jgi:hypothetical protein